MAIIHVADRHTDDKTSFESNLKSINSLIYVSSDTKIDSFEISLTVGETYASSFPANDEALREISEEGVILRPNTPYIISTHEEVRLPHNVFGIIFPKGSLFVKYAVCVPTSKIDPGFRDNLYIFIQNYGSKPYKLKRGDIIASVSFFTTDSTPLNLSETKKPPYRNRSVRGKDVFLRYWLAIKSRLWDVLVGGGVAVALIEIFFRDK